MATKSKDGGKKKTQKKKDVGVVEKGNEDMKDVKKDGEVDDPEDLVETFQLTELELTQLNLHETRVQLQQNVMEKIKYRLDLLAIDYQRQKDQHKAAMRDCENSRKEAADDYVAVRNRIQERLGVDLSKYLINDEGILTPEEDIG